jgi:hypothetical protein
MGTHWNSIEIPTIVVCHMTKAIQQLGLVVWGEMDPPKSKGVVLLSGLITCFLVVLISKYM